MKVENVDKAIIQSFKIKIIKWAKSNYYDFPWRNSNNKWHSLVAEIMLQRTRAEQVVPVFNQFCSKYSTPLQYLEDKDSAVFNSLGLLWREKELKKLAKVLSSGEIPTDKNKLMALPGVGDYIASAYRSLHLGIRDVIIDSNVVRLYGRFFGFKTDGETRRKNWFRNLADIVTPQKKFKVYNYGIIDFTRTVCKTKPVCETCILNRKCHFYNFLFF